MIHDKGFGLRMITAAVILPLLLSVVFLASSAVRAETGNDDGSRTSSVHSSKSDDGPEKGAGASQVRLKRSPPSGQGVGEKGSFATKLKQSKESDGKELLSETDLRWKGTEGKSLDDDQLMERDGGDLEEVLGDGVQGASNGKLVVKGGPLRDGIKTRWVKVADNATESDRKRTEEESNRFVSRSKWGKLRSRTRRDLRALKRMLDDAGFAPVHSEGNLPEEDEGPPEVNEEDGDAYEDSIEVPQIGESLSGDATRRQDFSKRPKYYPDWGPKRTWRINMMRVWGKRDVAGYDRNYARWND